MLFSFSTKTDVGNSSPFASFSSLYHSDAVSIVPKRHDEYDRFLSAAWPYYAGALSTSMGFIVFTVIYLGGEVDRRVKGKGKSTKAE